nr:helix-turn-helix domain-containing protein [Myxococcota bacterium]
DGARHRVAKLARSFIEENYRNAIRLEDLCTVTGVGIRTLQRCFREYFALTIMEYIKTVRLEAARRHLAAADPAHDSVTQIALEHGFAHLGRFSIAFRERFGESPNETLRNRRERRPVAS